MRIGYNQFSISSLLFCLQEKIARLAVDIVRSPDTLLKKLPCVVTGDSVILDECESWFNMTTYILEQYDLAGHLTRLFGLNSWAES